MTTDAPYQRQMLMCRARAKVCRLEADNLTGYDREAWLCLADNWDIMADEFERIDAPQMVH